MDIIRKGLAGLTAGLFILAAILSMMGFNLEHKAFLAETYKQAFATENFYERLPSSMAQAIVGTKEMQSLPLGIRSMSVDQWEIFLRELLPPDLLKVMGDQAIDSLIAYLNSETDEAVVELTPLKTQMSGGMGAQAVTNLMRTLPPCTLDELTRITISFLNEQELTFCNPPIELDTFVQPLIQEQVRFAAISLPDQVVIASYVPTAGETDSRQRIQILRLVLRLTPILPLLLLLAMTLLAVRSLRDWLGWWGVPFVVTGLAVNVMAWMGAPLTRLILLNLLLQRAPKFLPPVLFDDASSLVSAIVDQTLQPLSLQGLALAVLGTLMIALALGVHLHKQNKA